MSFWASSRASSSQAHAYASSTSMSVPRRYSDQILVALLARGVGLGRARRIRVAEPGRELAVRGTSLPGRRLEVPAKGPVAVPGDELAEPAAGGAVAGPGRALVGDGEGLPPGCRAAVLEARREALAVAGHGAGDVAEARGDRLPGLGRGPIHEVEDGARAGRWPHDDAQRSLAFAGLDDAELAAGEIDQESLSEALGFVLDRRVGDIPDRAAEEVGQGVIPGG